MLRNYFNEIPGNVSLQRKRLQKKNTNKNHIYEDCFVYDESRFSGSKLINSTKKINR